MSVIQVGRRKWVWPAISVHFYLESESSPRDFQLINQTLVTWSQKWMRNRYVAGHITVPEQNTVSISREQGRVFTFGVSSSNYDIEGEPVDIK